MDYFPPSPPSQPSDSDLSGLKQLAEISLATASAPVRPDLGSLLTSLLYPSLTISPSSSPSPPPAHAVSADVEEGRELWLLPDPGRAEAEVQGRVLGRGKEHFV